MSTLTASQQRLLDKQCEHHFQSTGLDMRERLTKQILGTDNVKHNIVHKCKRVLNINRK